MVFLEIAGESVAMSKERITRRQKDMSRLLREKKKVQRDTIRKNKKKKNIREVFSHEGA